MPIRVCVHVFACVCMHVHVCMCEKQQLQVPALSVISFTLSSNPVGDLDTTTSPLLRCSRTYHGPPTASGSVGRCLGPHILEHAPRTWASLLGPRVPPAQSRWERQAWATRVCAHQHLLGAELLTSHTETTCGTSPPPPRCLPGSQSGQRHA